METAPNKAALPRPVMTRLLTVLVGLIVLSAAYLVGYDQGARTGGSPLGSRMSEVEQKLAESGLKVQTSIAGTVASSSSDSVALDVPIDGSVRRVTVTLAEGVRLVTITQKDPAALAAEEAAYAAASARYRAQLDAAAGDENTAALPTPPTPPMPFIETSFALADLTEGDRVVILVDGDASEAAKVTATSLSLVTAVEAPTLVDGEAAIEAPFGGIDVRLSPLPPEAAEPVAVEDEDEDAAMPAALEAAN
jgi:hypothetical protein